MQYEQSYIKIFTKAKIKILNKVLMILSLPATGYNKRQQPPMTPHQPVSSSSPLQHDSPHIPNTARNITANDVACKPKTRTSSSGKIHKLIKKKVLVPVDMTFLQLAPKPFRNKNTVSIFILRCVVITIRAVTPTWEIN